ncbi:hypothetical protein [Streptomyces sp. ME19-01-6]|uniref:hypothetical protein n=1 Tax=Streptomyces sp. ME19-01-6 TaxID=3028686 RepID=UPI0029B5692F|nr:hypothetical protein [Streptomyces sp. ME19-01-6]MDX3232877.1 hypothetical protein [Streptomyces sp. ME19-01-6]
MWVDPKQTSETVTFGIQQCPWLDAGDLQLTFDYLEEQAKAEAQKPQEERRKVTSPDDWEIDVFGPLIPQSHVLNHQQILTALRTVAFNDPASSPWGAATKQVRDWLLLPEAADRSTVPALTGRSAAAVVLAALYGAEGHYLMAGFDARE